MYQLLLRELKDARVMLAEQHGLQESPFKAGIVISVDPATGRLEACLSD
ncbi:MAG TPA: hypothetical protein PKC98_07020 [Candidatus Melainabacteria bacterium]|nr:hypothetical protein [Candidatus Melainabacteria bacterium]